MIATQLLLAVAAGLASAQNSCSQNTFTINSQADITTLAGSCKTLTGNVQVGTQTDATLDFSGITTVKGDFDVLNNKFVTSLKSTSLGQITGAFHLQNLTALSNLQFTSLNSVGSVNFVSLTALDTFNFGSAGIATAKSVVVSDTFLSSLDGLNVVSVADMDINNNRRLVKYSSSLANLTDNLNINANGLNLQVSLPDLIWISNMTISNVSTFDVPSLSVVNGSMRFDSNFFSSFSAPNLTSTSSGDISFVSNAQLANITMPSLTAVGGGFLIANNTALQNITGFPKLKTIGGAVKLRGSFKDVELPDLNDVKGAFDLVSADDITSSCKNFGQLAPGSQGGGGQIQGTYNCQSNNANANSDTGSGGSGSSGGSSGSGNNNNGNSATGTVVNMVAMLGLTVAGALFML